MNSVNILSCCCFPSVYCLFKPKRMFYQKSDLFDRPTFCINISQIVLLIFRSFIHIQLKIFTTNLKRFTEKIVVNSDAIYKVLNSSKNKYNTLSLI